MVKGISCCKLEKVTTLHNSNSNMKELVPLTDFINLKGLIIPDNPNSTIRNTIIINNTTPTTYILQNLIMVPKFNHCLIKDYKAKIILSNKLFNYYLFNKGVQTPNIPACISNHWK